MHTRAIFCLILPVTFGWVISLGAQQVGTTDPGGRQANDTQPQELGRIHWRRGFDEAVAVAKTENKPLLVLFQEVPGCSTCVNYGQQVLSHPLIVEAAESLFVPVAVYNNIEGQDQRTLKSFREPAWNNPVVRIIDTDRDALAPRVAGDYSICGLAGAMVGALDKLGRSLPMYLQLLAEERSAKKKELEKATFAMHCFWEGEGALGNISGVYETMPGFLEQLEVVEVVFDPEVIKFETLLNKARGMQCASKVFTRSSEQQAVASRVVGSDARRSDDPIRPDKQPKYYLSNTPLKYVPMTELQACRVNAALGHKKSPREYLSPRQLDLLDLITANTAADWPVAIGADITTAWQKARALAETLSPS